MLVLIELPRMALQFRQGKRNLNKVYASSYRVRKAVVTAKSAEKLNDILCKKWQYSDYELVAIIKDNGIFYAFLNQRK